MLAVALAALVVPPANAEQDISMKTKQVRVYGEAGRFGGWPANHGIWIWDNEILVGFSRGYHQALGEERHNIDREKPEEHMLARSLDGGETWTLEHPMRNGDLVARGSMLHGVETPGVPLPPITEFTGAVDFTHPDFAMAVRMNDHNEGPSRFEYSYDRGKTWKGPFAMPQMGTPGILGRTEYHVVSKHEAWFYLTAAKPAKTEGHVFVARTTDGCKTWEFLSHVGPEPSGFAIMPSAVRLSDSDVLVTTRRREEERRWIDAWKSGDNGKTWTALPDPIASAGEGNPPAMIQLQDGRVCLTYGYRATPFKMCAKLSNDGGETWSDEIVLRTGGGGRDMGYPRTVQRPDGKVVTIYYFWDKTLGNERFIEATIWDPANVK
jgi:hypothetical protein